MKWFDYVFYRAAIFFFKRDGFEADRAIWLVTAMQVFIILNICLTYMFFVFEGSWKEYRNIFMVIFTVLLFAGYIFNRLRYRGRYEEYKTKFKELPTQRLIGGIAIWAIMILLFWYPLFFLSVFGTTFLNK